MRRSQPDRRFRNVAILTTVLAVASLAVYAIDVGAVAHGGDLDGRAVFAARGCTGCHMADGVGHGGVGPDLTDLASRAGSQVEGMSAEAYVRQSIREPQAFRAKGFEGGFVQMPT
ncbi:MAG TPA: c-type cytochrome, partial [Acidimicrobiia bacterium]|nr:c-type cytochrome [Acidimicrobiia bacterium]